MTLKHFKKNIISLEIFGIDRSFILIDGYDNKRLIISIFSNSTATYNAVIWNLIASLICE